jgi:enoyl-CoA hydratase/carnithine racemase
MPISKMGIPLPNCFYKVSIDTLGAHKAQEMFLRAAFITAADSYSNGLARTMSFPDPVELRVQVIRLLSGIAAYLPESLAYTKSVFNILTLHTGLNAQQENALSRRFEDLAGSRRSRSASTH